MSCRNLLKLFSTAPNLYASARATPALARNALRLCNPRPPRRFCAGKAGVALGVSLLTWLGFRDEDKDKESELIMTLKRAVLCTKREQYDKAEQMLHLALRLAQQEQNHQGVIYCFDLMANLAMDRLQLDKAEKLFVSVLQLLLGDGVKESDLKVIHVSLKLARISQLKADIEKAQMGYMWCLENIEKQKNDSVDAEMLYGVIQDWYAQFLLDVGDAPKAVVHLSEAYNVCKRTKGPNSEQSMLLLNDLGTTSFRAGDIERAQGYLKEAISVGQCVEDKSHLGVVHANLGLILLQKGVAKEAEIYCSEALRLGKKHENNESVEQAKYCFDQIKLALGK